MSEKRYFRLRGLRVAPKRHAEPLASTCLVQTAEGAGHCFISFSEDFVLWVGHRLPRGVSWMDPAYIAVVQTAEDWEVSAVYVDRSASTLLWKSKTKPDWIGKLRQEKTDGNTTKNAAFASAAE